MSTQISDIIVPQRFAPYVQILTEQKSRLIRSGAVASSPFLTEQLAGGGRTFNVPAFEDIDDEDNQLGDVVGTGLEATGDATYQGITTNQQVAVRLNRNQQWRTYDLAATLAGADPADAVAGRVSDFWARKLQQIFVNTWNGVIADNAQGSPNGTGATDDLVLDISGASYVAGTTDFSAEAFINAKTLLGDSMDDLSVCMVHSTVYSRMLKNNLIDFISDSVNGNAIQVPTFLGFEVIVDDSMPVDGVGAVFDTWLFGPGSSQLGTGSPKVPAEVERQPEADLGAGAEALYSRVQYALHPNGHAWIGNAAAEGGPTNTELAAGATNWSRVFPERKQIKMVRLVTRENANT